jgi:hypothetical protein
MTKTQSGTQPHRSEAKMLNQKIWKWIAAWALCSLAALAQEPGQKTFASPSEAAQALYNAGKANDSSTLAAVLGASSGDILSSGDPVQDNNARENFITKFEQMNRLGKEADGSLILYIGADNWPFPVSLKQANGQWYFDTLSGKQEIVFRRIGKNEYAAMRVMNALADAQLDYYERFSQYAGKWVSSEGKQDGLYWKAGEGQPESPVGPLVASAAAEGYTNSVHPEPFHGYFFRMLTAQGANANGGPKAYVVNGKMTGGFAFVAYPADYRSSGVMTFLIDQNGVIYEKDLGPTTADVATTVTTFNPDKTWTEVPGDEAQADAE